jgi:hypothetical protein
MPAINCEIAAKASLPDGLYRRLRLMARLANLPLSLLQLVSLGIVLGHFLIPILRPPP